MVRFAGSILILLGLSISIGCRRPSDPPPSLLPGGDVSAMPIVIPEYVRSEKFLGQAAAGEAPVANAPAEAQQQPAEAETPEAASAEEATTEAPAENNTAANAPEPAQPVQQAPAPRQERPKSELEREMDVAPGPGFLNRG